MIRLLVLGLTGALVLVTLGWRGFVGGLVAIVVLTALAGAGIRADGHR